MIILFYHLQRLPRTGWVGRVQNPETVSSHIFRTALLGFVLRNSKVDIGKYIKYKYYSYTYNSIYLIP